jgi:hypothetical protein
MLGEISLGDSLGENGAIFNCQFDLGTQRRFAAPPVGPVLTR